MTEDTRTDLGWATQMSATRRYARWRNQRIAAAVTGITLVAGGLLAASTTPPAAADTGLTAPVQLNTDSNGIERSAIRDFAVSGDGRYATFGGVPDAYAPGCTLGSPNCGTRIFAKNLASGAVSPVGDGDVGQLPASNEYASAMSFTGRYVAFLANADNLVPGIPSNQSAELFVRDRDVDNSGTYDTPGNTSITLLSREWTPATGQGAIEPSGVDIYGV